MYHSNAAHAPPARRATRLFVWFIAVLVLALIVSPVSAQPRPLQSGVGAVGQIDAAAPLSLFVYPGLEGELVTIQLFGLTSGFIPTLTLLNSSQQPIGTPSGSPSAVTLTTILPSDGNYSLLIGSLTGQPGEFAIRVDSSVTGQAFPMLPDEELRAEVAPNGDPQVLMFETVQAGFALHLGDPFTVDSTAGDLRFQAKIVAANGGLLAQFNGVYGALTLIPAGAGRVYVIIQGSTPEDSGGLDIVLRSPGTSPQSTSSDSSSSSSSSSVNPVQTPEVTGPSTTSSNGGCTLIAGPNGVNVRSGDGTGFAVITQIEPNGPRAVTGRNASNSWVTIDVNGSLGWVAVQVVTLTGPCDNLPVLTAGSAPPQPTTSSGATATSTSGSGPTATLASGSSVTPTTPSQTGPTATPTSTTAGEQPTQPSGPTATYTPTPPVTATHTATYTPSYTPTTAPAAPPDANTHRFDVHRNNGGTFNEVISYPDGDTTDRIEMRVDLGQVGGEATRTVTLTLNCNGSGTQSVRFTLTSPNAQRYGCGQSITVRYSAPFSTGYYYVFVEDGGPSYVNYTLVAATQP